MASSTSYQASDYTEKELIEDILGLNDPNDNELEARINQLIQKYTKDVPSNNEQMLYDFFNDVYDRFFESEETQNQGIVDDASDSIEEEYTETPENYTMTNTTSDDTPIRLNKEGTNLEDTSNINAGANNIRVTKQVDLIRGKVNPLLLQTIRRVISIDSQYRPNPGDTLPAEFTFNLSDPLRDVVSLKLYSIGIPYTWYTVNDNFGSNFFFIQGNAPGITSDNYKFQISIPTGNYSASDLITTINTDLKDKLINTNSSIANGFDMSFGNTSITYNPNRSRSTLNLDFSKTHTESSYDFTFSTWTSPIDPTENDNVNIDNAGERFKSIPGFLGFNHQNYNLNSFRSARTIPQTANDPNNDYYVDTGSDTSNNYFQIIHYCGTDSTTFSPPYSSSSIIKNRFMVELPSDLSGNHKRSEIVQGLNNVLTSSEFLKNSNIVQRDINDISQNNNGESYFDLTLNFDRTYEPLTPYSKMHIEFPDEAALNIIDTSRIWVGDLSACFGFSDLSYNNGEIFGESDPVGHDSTNPTVKYTMESDLPYYEIRCIRPGFDVSENNFAVALGGSVPANAQATNKTSLALDEDLSNNKLVANTSYTHPLLIKALTDSMKALQKISITANEPTGVIDPSSEFFETNDTDINFRLALKKSFTSDNYRADLSYNSDPTDISYSFLQLISPIGEVATNLRGLDLSQNMSNIGNQNIFTNSFNVTNRPEVQIDISNSFVLKVSPKDNSGNQQVPPYIINIHDYLDLSYNENGQLVSNGTHTKHGTDGTIGYDVSYNGITYDISFDSFTQVNGNNVIQFANSNNIVAPNSVPIPPYLQLPGFFNYMFDNFKRDGKNPLQGTKLEIQQTSSIEFDEQVDTIDISFVIVANEDLSTNDYEIQFFDPTNMPNSPGTISHNFYTDEANPTVDTRNQNFWIGDLLFDPSFVDVSGIRLDDIYETTTNSDGKIKPFVEVNEFTEVETSIENTVTTNNTLTEQRRQPVITIDTIVINNNNNQFIINANEEGVNNNENNFTITVPNATYRRNDLMTALNEELSYSPLTIRNSEFILQFEIIQNNGVEQSKLSISGYKYFNVEDLKITFYDGNAFAECYAGVSSIRSATSDATLGWLMGFRNKLIYELNDTTIKNYQMASGNNALSIEGDSVVTTDLYNKLFIVLDDYNQSRLNDGLITNITNEDNIALPSYATRNRLICDPVTGQVSNDLNQNINGNVLTENRIQAATAISQETANSSSRQGGKGPFAKDVFAVIPIKTNALNPGQVYTEFGGTLQNQERIYFGPVNISRMSVKLMTDRGDVVDLNNADWTFSLIAEQLYQSSTT